MRYACKFCVALYGLKAGDYPSLAQTREQVVQHMKAEHRYPGRRARAVLGEAYEMRLAAKLIESTGPVLGVHPPLKLRGTNESVSEAD